MTNLSRHTNVSSARACIFLIVLCALCIPGFAQTPNTVRAAEFGASGTIMVAAANAAEAPIPDARQIIAAFQATLAAQFPYVFQFTATAQRSDRAKPGQPIIPEVEGDRISYREGELGSDGHRVALRMKTWGQISGYKAAVPKSRAKYNRHVYDGREMWLYSKLPQMDGPGILRNGGLGIYPGLSNKWVPGTIGAKAPTHPLQGYLTPRIRVDELFRNAAILTTRKARETVGDSVCYVVDFSSPYGEGAIWFDPASGYLPAQAEVFIGPSHLIPSGARGPAGYSIHVRLWDASFSKVDGVWFATAATVATELHTPEWRHTGTTQTRITRIRAHADMDALGLFSKDDIEDGAIVGGSYGRPGHLMIDMWRGGRRVPTNYRDLWR